MEISSFLESAIEEHINDYGEQPLTNVDLLKIINSATNSLAQFQQSIDDYGEPTPWDENNLP